MDLSPETFERLLSWLHSDRDEAGQEYQKIRTLLIKHFQSHGRSYPEKLADSTIDRVAQTLTPEKIEKWVGKEKNRYFFRVGFYILCEDRNHNRRETQLPDELDVINQERDEDVESRSYCLDKCVQNLSTAERELIGRYYCGNKTTKSENRAKLAVDLNIDLPALRVRALRIRTKLRKCIERCLEKADKSLRA